MEKKNNNINKVLKVLPFVFGGITLVFAGLFTWKVLASKTNNGGGGGGGGGTDETHKLTFAGEDCKLLDQDGNIVTEANLISGKTYHFTLTVTDSDLHDLPPYVVFDDENINYNYNNQNGDLAVSINKDALLEASAPHCVTQFINAQITGDTTEVLYCITFGDTEKHPATINWGDGSPVDEISPADGVDYYNNGISHDYTESGVYTVTIHGAVKSIKAKKEDGSDSDLVKNCEELILGDSIYEIEDSSYVGSSYKKIIVSEGVCRLGDTAFANSNNLTYVKLPSTLTHLGSGGAVFYDTPLETVIFAPYTNFEILVLPFNGNGLFSSCFPREALKTIYIGRHSIWHSVINDFSSFEQLESIVFADENDCPTVIMDGSFNYCKLLNTDFLKNVTYIGGTSGCFVGSNLVSVTFSPKIAYIGANFADDCEISELVFTSTIPPIIDTSTFLGITSSSYDIIVPKGTSETYKRAWAPIVAETTPEIIDYIVEAE